LYPMDKAIKLKRQGYAILAGAGYQPDTILFP
jgi:hypothetical protein